MQAEKVIQKKTVSHKNSSLASLLLLCLYAARTGEGKRYEINYFRSFLSVFFLTYSQRKKLPVVICSRHLGSVMPPNYPSIIVSWAHTYSRTLPVIQDYNHTETSMSDGKQQHQHLPCSHLNKQPTNSGADLHRSSK